MSDHRPIATKRTMKEKIFQEFKEVVPMFLYLWLLFALFTYHEAIALARHNISYAPFGLGFVNAFVFAKVMLVAEKLRIGTRFRKKAPVFPIFYKSFLFALTFICFNLAEEVRFMERENDCGEPSENRGRQPGRNSDRWAYHDNRVDTILCLPRAQPCPRQRCFGGFVS